MKPIVPKLSVVIPFLNEVKYINPLLKSLARQKTSVPYEVIFVDNNSVDSTKEIINQYRNQLPQLQIILEPKQGIGHARQTGFSQAKSQIIVSTDADCYLPQDWLDQIWVYFHHHPEMLAVSGPYQLQNKSWLFNRLFVLILIFADHLHRTITGSYPLRGNNFAIKKSAWRQAGGFNLNLSALEDIEFSLRVMKIGHIGYSSKNLVYTVDRRFKHKFFYHLFHRLHAYFYRVILRNHSRVTHWDPIR